MTTTDHWYAVYLGKDDNAPHAGFYRVIAERNDDGNRVLACQIAFDGKLDGDDIKHEANCRIVLERRNGRFTPLKSEYKEPESQAELRFDDGKIHAKGAASDNDGSTVPDDVIPTYAVFLLAEGIFNSPESSVAFSAINEGTGGIAASEAKLVARGQTDETPFRSDGKLWRVDWLNSEETCTQSYYFNDEGVLVQADWGGSLARLVDSSTVAIPEGFSPPKFLQDV